jgi:hypothetical protein
MNPFYIRERESLVVALVDEGLRFCPSFKSCHDLVLNARMIGDHYKS